MFVFVKAFQGKAKEDNRPFQALTLARLTRNEETQELEAQLKEFFVDVKMNCNFAFGDIVDVVWSDDGFGGARKPIKLGLAENGDSPFEKLVD